MGFRASGVWGLESQGLNARGLSSELKVGAEGGGWGLRAGGI